MRRSALNPKRTTTLYKLKNRDSKFEKDFGLLAASGHDESAAELGQRRKDPQEEGRSTATRKKSTKSLSFTGGRAREPNGYENCNGTDERMPE